jgi:hypothetical protein
MLDFEARKDVAAIFAGIVRIESGGQFPGLDYLLKHLDLMETLFSG